MTDSLTSAGLFLINTLFDLYIIVLIARILFAWAHADYHNPLTQVIVKLTQPLVSPLRRIIPNVKNIELSTLILIVALEILKFFLIGLIVFGLPSNFLGLIILALSDMLKLFLYTFFYAILIQVIISWVQPGNSPVTRALTKITSPIIRPIQRIIPPVNGFDLSPIPALIILQLLIILLVTPLQSFGTSIAFG